MDKIHDTQAIKTAKKKSLFWRILGYIFLSLFLVMVIFFAGYQLFLKPMMSKPISPKLNQELDPLKTQIVAYYQEEKEEVKEELINEIEFPEHLEEPPLFLEVDEFTDTDETPRVCGMPKDMVFLLVGVDSKKDWTYRAGLADVIRLIRVDFVNKKINMIALPRDMLVDFPEGRASIESPMKINQAYTIGTAGAQQYIGEGNGAHSLAEAIDFNFGVSVDHYMVVNFKFVINVIDEVGGLDVYLPQEVEDDYFGYYPAGPQHLDGIESLVLMRIRMKYTDDFRVGNQTIILKAMFEKMKRPGMILRLPGLINQFRENVLTDLSVEELIRLGNCLLTEFEIEDINARQFTKEHIKPAREYIPSMKLYLFVYKWGDEAVEYIHNTLMGK